MASQDIRKCDRKGPLTNSLCERTQLISQFLKIRMHAQEECFIDKDVLFEEHLFETVEIQNLMVEGLHQIFARPKAPQCSLFCCVSTCFFAKTYLPVSLGMVWECLG